MTQRMVCRIAWTSHGVRQFEREVNSCLMEGWIVRDISVVPRVFRTLCLALLESPEPQAITMPDSN